MEMRTTKPMQLNSNWLYMNLKQHKRWFLMAAVLISVTAIILPLLLDAEPMPYVMAALVELFVLSFFMVLSQLEFLHNPKAFSYYQSKALPLKSRIHGIILTQAVFTYSFYILLKVWLIFANNQIWPRTLIQTSRWINYATFEMAGSWIAILLLLTALSALLSGTKASAAFSTIFNFSLPMLALGIVYFVLNVANASTVGFNVSVIMETILQKYYRINLIYHYWSTWESTLVILSLTLLIIYGIMLWVIKNHKGENIGQLFIFKGYKIFVLIMLSMIVPLSFSVLLPDVYLISKWIAILMISELTLYMVLSIVEKSMKLNSKSVKLLIIFGVFITILIGSTSFFLNQYANNMPLIEEIEAVALSPVTAILSNESIPDGGSVYYSEEAKATILNLHHLLLKTNKALLNYDFNIVYYLKDGNKRIFPFSPLPPRVIYEDGFDGFDNFAKDMMSMNEFWENVTPLVYDDDIIRAKSANVIVREMGTFLMDSNDLDDFTTLLKLDHTSFKNKYDFWTHYPYLGAPFNYGSSYDSKYKIQISTDTGQIYIVNILKEQHDLIEWINKKFK